MAKRPALSKAEIEVARVLWELESASVRQVHDAISKDREIDFATVQTYLRRLESKGYAKTRLDGRVRIYSPKVRPTTVIRETVNDLIDRLFAGDTMPLMRHLVDDGKVTSKELSELRKRINELDKKNSDAGSGMEDSNE